MTHALGRERKEELGNMWAARFRNMSTETCDVKNNNHKPKEWAENIRRPHKGYRALAAATEADWARDAIHELRCRHCPCSGFENPVELKHHHRDTVTVRPNHSMM